MRADLKAGTKSAYSSAVSKYLRFCDGLRIRHSRNPITERQLCMLCWLYCHGAKSTGLATWLSAVEDWHKRQGFPPLPRGERYLRTCRSIRNIFGLIDVRAGGSCLQASVASYSVAFGSRRLVASGVLGGLLAGLPGAVACF